MNNLTPPSPRSGRRRNGSRSSRISPRTSETLADEARRYGLIALLRLIATRNAAFLESQRQAITDAFQPEPPEPALVEAWLHCWEPCWEPMDPDHGSEVWLAKEQTSGDEIESRRVTVAPSLLARAETLGAESHALDDLLWKLWKEQEGDAPRPPRIETAPDWMSPGARTTETIRRARPALRSGRDGVVFVGKKARRCSRSSTDSPRRLELIPD